MEEENATWVNLFVNFPTGGLEDGGVGQVKIGEPLCLREGKGKGLI